MRNAPFAPEHIAVIESLDQEGRGVAHVDGKVIFIEGAMTGERVTYQSFKRKPTYEIGTLAKVIKASSLRVTPQCPHFGVCGGCAMQHVESGAQVAAKQRMLEDNLWHISKLKPENILSPIYGPAWGYRHKARLRVKLVLKKGKVLVGFNEKGSPFIADIQQCLVLPPQVSKMLVPMQAMLAKLYIRDSLPQMELAVGEDVTVFVFRIMEALSVEDEALVKAFADEHQVQIWLQTKGPDSAAPFYPLDAPALNYSLPEYDLKYPFFPTEFTQVNPYINRVMVRRAMRMLDPQPNERIADFFCGLGNFTLPIARSGAKVYGVEGSAGLVKRAIEGAALNGLTDLATFGESDLFKVSPESLAALGYFDKWLIDPPRDGAAELIKALDDDGKGNPKRIVYVSCNPATLARDAGLLANRGYHLVSAGVINMFPHTAHVESMALFELIESEVG